MPDGRYVGCRVRATDFLLQIISNYCSMGGGGLEEMHFVPLFQDRIYKEKQHASVLYVFPF